MRRLLLPENHVAPRLMVEGKSKLGQRTTSLPEHTGSLGTDFYHFLID
jgi:hypothetical protein